MPSRTNRRTSTAVRVIPYTAAALVPPRPQSTGALALQLDQAPARDRPSPVKRLSPGSRPQSGSRPTPGHASPPARQPPPSGPPSPAGGPLARRRPPGERSVPGQAPRPRSRPSPSGPSPTRRPSPGGRPSADGPYGRPVLRAVGSQEPDGDLGAVAAATLRLVAEVLAGARPVRQLARRATPQVCGGLAAFAGPAAGGPIRPPRVLTSWVQEPAPGAAEAGAVIALAGRVQALALRLEHHRGRWRCTALETTAPAS